MVTMLEDVERVLFSAPEIRSALNPELVPDPTAETLQRERNKLVQTRREGHQYLDWSALREQVDETGIYVHDSYGYGWPAVRGAHLLTAVRQRVMLTGCSRIEIVLPLECWPTPPDPSVWRLHGTDEQGRGLVSGGDNDEFAWAHFLDRVPGAEPITVAALTRAGLRRHVDRVVQKRLAANAETVPEAVRAARPVVTAVFCNTYAEMQGLEACNSLALWVAGNHAGEAFDRAYGLGRIQAAGIDPDQHPEYRRYQTYYDIGLPPPTHADMADEIIRRFSDRSGAF